MTDQKTVQDEDAVVLGDKRVEIVVFDRYKGRKGTTDRLALATPHLLRAVVHYHENKGYRCATPKGGARGTCCQMVGEPEQKFGLVMFHYTTDDNGELMDATKLQGRLKLWPISETRYAELTAIHRKWPLLDGPPAGFAVKQHDVTAKCTEEQYQKMAINVCPEAHWKSKQQWYDAVVSKMPKAYERMKLALGKAMTEQDWQELFGKGRAATAPTQSSDIDLSDVLDEEASR